MSVPTSFEAAEVLEAKAPNTLVHRNLSAPKPNEVAIKITATAINPVDWKIRDSDTFLNGYPAVLGSEAAGNIAAVGSDVKDFQVGDRVFFEGIIGTYESSTFQQYCKMPAELVLKTPKNITDEEAAGIMRATIAVVVAFYAPEGHGMTPPWVEGGQTVGKGKSIAIIGGSSSVGQYAIQLAHLSGYDRIITNASPHHHDFLKSLGAHVVLDRSTSTPQAFAEETGEYPLDFVLDTISLPATQILGVQIVQTAGVHKGQLITLHVIVPTVPNPEAVALAQNQETPVEVKQVVALGYLPQFRFLSEPFVKILGGEDGYIARGLFLPNRVEVVPGGLSAVEDALGKSKRGVSGKKLVLRPFQT